MTDKSTLIALADKLEKATAPSRELDARIQCYLDGADYDRLCGGAEVIASDIDAPRYTANTDAALTLRPPGWLLTGLSDGTIDLKYRDVRRQTNWRAGFAPEGATINGPDDVGKMVSGMGANAAMSVCAAALRARAA